MRIHLLAAVAAAGLMAGPAWAGGDTSAASRSSPAASQSSASAERSGSSASAGGAMMTQAELQQQIGKDIQTRSGDTVGRLDDIVLDAGGKPQKAIIALSDSSKNVAVPFAELQQDGANWSLKSQSKQQLATMSSYQHDPNTVSLNHPRGSSGSSSTSPSSRSLDSTAPSSALPSGSGASPPSSSNRTQP